MGDDPQDKDPTHGDQAKDKRPDGDSLAPERPQSLLERRRRAYRRAAPIVAAAEERWAEIEAQEAKKPMAPAVEDAEVTSSK
jgi:hypothetical protein